MSPRARSTTAPATSSPRRGRAARASATADVDGALGGDISGLTYDGSGTATPDVLWAVNNGDGTLLRLLWNGPRWVTDTDERLDQRRQGDEVRRRHRHADAEGVTVGGRSSAAGIYTSTERNNDVSGVSRPAILRFDVVRLRPRP